MYPARQLNDLERAKLLVRHRIAQHRRECVEAAREVTLPLVWADEAVSFWRSLSPWTRWLSIPAGFLATRLLSRTLRPFGGLRQWFPVAFNLAQRLWR